MFFLSQNNTCYYFVHGRKYTIEKSHPTKLNNSNNKSIVFFYKAEVKKHHLIDLLLYFVHMNSLEKATQWISNKLRASMRLTILFDC